MPTVTASTSMTYLLLQLLALLVAAPLLYGLHKLFIFFYAQWTSPLHVLPGPPNASLLFGNMKEIWKAVCTISRLILDSSHTFTAASSYPARKMGQRVWVNHHIQGPLWSRVYWKQFIMIFWLILDADESSLYYRYESG